MNNRNIVPGTVCWIVASKFGNEGRVVTARKYFPNIRVSNGEQEFTINCWELDEFINDNKGKLTVKIIDELALKPLDNPKDDVVDESYAWLPSVGQERSINV